MLKKLYTLVACALFFNLYDYVNLGDVFRQGKFRFMLFALCPVVFCIIKKNMHWTFAFFASYLLFSWTLHNYQVAGIMSVALTFSVFTMAYFLMRMKADEFGEMLVWFGVFQSIVAILQWQGIHFLFVPGQEWGMHLPTGTYGHNTILGPFLVCCLAPALWLKKYLQALPIIFVCLISDSTMTIASLTVVCLVYAWYLYSFKVAFFGAATAAVACIAGYFLTIDQVRDQYQFYNLNGRNAFWDAGLRAFQDAPLWGGGPGSWVSMYTGKYMGLHQGTIVLQLHNDWLEYAVEYGAIPFAVLCVGLVQFIWKFKPTWYHAVCAALLVNALANFPFQIVTLSLIFCVCFLHSMRQNVTMLT